MKSPYKENLKLFFSRVKTMKCKKTEVIKNTKDKEGKVIVSRKRKYYGKMAAVFKGIARR